MAINFDKLNSGLSNGIGMAAPFAAMALNAINTSSEFAHQQKIAEMANKRQREAEQMAMAQQQHLQRMADAYNSPSAQMARLREAGLNPMIAFANGVGGNLSTGVPNVVTPQSMNIPSASASSTDLLSAFTTLNDTLNKRRELDIMQSSAEFNNAKTDAERQTILKDLSFKDAIEHDRHSEVTSRLLNNEAQRELYFAQKDKLISDAIQARNELIENRRQFDVNMRFLKRQEGNKFKLRAYEMQFEAAMKAKEQLANEKLSAATNSTWINATLLNSDWQKYKFYRDNGGSLRDATIAGSLNGRYGTLSAPSIGAAMFDERVKNAYDRYSHTEQSADDARSGNKAKYKHAKDKLGRVSYTNSTGTNR